MFRLQVRFYANQTFFFQQATFYSAITDITYNIKWL